MDHELRFALNNEIFSGRPFVPVAPPARVRHFAFVHDDQGAESHARLEALCQGLGVGLPPANARHHLAEIDSNAVLKWERHGEFTTWTLVEHETDAASSELSVERRDWTTDLPGRRLIAIDLALIADTGDGAPSELAARLFRGTDHAGSDISGGLATVWTDFRIHADGYTRFLVAERELGDLRTGRLVRRLLEIETYRMMALLALPLARELAPELDRLDRALADVITAMGGDAGGIAEDQALLTELTALARDVELVANRTSFRFGAARAYDGLVSKRLAELSEERRGTLQKLSTFLDRRFKPAMQTCEATAGRIESLARRVARAGNLLRTRVDIVLEAQNQRLLSSMDERAQLQLRLQQTVEGLSVVAISYYLHGLLSKVLDPVMQATAGLDPKFTQALAAPLVLGIVWLVLRRVRRHLIANKK